MSNNLPILTSRSQIESRQRCERLNYWQYHHEMRGLDLDGSAVALNIGSCVHAAIEAILKLRITGGWYTHLDLLRIGLDAAHAAPEFAALTEPLDQDLVDALVRTWWAVGLPQLAGWEVLEVEKEEVFDYPLSVTRFVAGNEIAHPFTYDSPKTVRFQSRSDWIARVKEFGTSPARNVEGCSQEGSGHPVEGIVTDTSTNLTLNGLPVPPGLYNWNLKTWRDCGERRRKSLLYDAQVFTELFGPEARLDERFAGVIYDVLIKEDHPLVWTWRSAKGGEIVARYRWTCETAHENTHTKAGGWCPGGKAHRLGGDYERVAVRDLPGGQAAWFERVQCEDPALLRDYHVILGPMMRPSDYVMEEWKESQLPREVEAKEAAAAVEAARAAGDDAEVERLLRRHFPKKTDSGNCVYPMECPALQLCWGAASADDFSYRIPNHPEELVQIKEAT